jgi:WD40 repeat protein
MTYANRSKSAQQRSGIFISYARGDGEAFAHRLRERLEKQDISLWQDRVKMEGGRDWWLQITEALDNVAFMALVMTPSALKSDVVRKEWRYARQQGVCVYPIKGSPNLDFSSLPRWMRDQHFYDLGSLEGQSLGPEWQKFLNDLDKTPDIRRVPFMVEDLTAGFIQRPNEFDQLIALLLDKNREEAVAITAALRGAGGYGKTTIAKALCHDERIQDAFDDGILWMTLGENPGDMTGRVEDLIQTLSGERPGFSNTEAAIARLKELLADRDILIVIDDVWNRDHLRPFMQGGPRCARLITTRNLDTLPSGAQAVKVDAMRPAEAIELLRVELFAAGTQGRDREGADEALRRLATRLGEWPLLLRLVNGALQDRVNNADQPLSDAIAYVNRALDKRGLTFFDARDTESRNQAVAKTLGVSFELLCDGERARYGELAVFPEDVEIPLATLSRLWEHTGGLDDFDTEEFCDRLNRLSLLLRLDMKTRHIRIHDVVRMYLIQEQGPKLLEIHRLLLEIHRPPTLPTSESSAPTWADLPAAEQYIWDHLAYHLIEAGHQEELLATVTNPRYLCAKVFVRNVQAVETDLLAAEAINSRDVVLPLLRRSFVQCGHILNRCASLRELEATLYSRVQHLEELAPFARQIAQILAAPFLTPWHPLPDLPHPALVRTLGKHTDSVTGCAISPDGLFIVSASSDQTLMVWDAASGAELLTLSGHKNTVTDCAISPDGSFIVSASLDRTLKVWDARSGAERLTLIGHNAAVRGCAISFDGSFIVSASSDETLKVWDANTGANRLTLYGCADWVNACAISPNGTFIISGSNDNSLRIWNATSGIETLRIQGHEDSVMDCAISPDGSFIVSASDDKTVKLWDAASGNERLNLSGHSGVESVVNACAISPDCSLIVSASADQTLKIWDLKTGNELLTLSGHSGVINDCAVSPDGSFIVSASADRTLKVWDARAGVERLTLKGHMDWVNSCAISMDGRLITSASDDKTLKVWDAENGACLATLHTDGPLNACAWFPDACHIVAAGNSGIYCLRLTR